MKANQTLKLKHNDNGYVKVVGGLVALLIMIIIGVLVFWEVSDSITLSNSDANASKNTTTDMATTVFGLLPLIALVVVAAIILGVILAFGSGKTGM